MEDVEDVEREAGPRSKEVTASRRLEVTWLESEAEVFLGGGWPMFLLSFSLSSLELRLNRSIDIKWNRELNQHEKDFVILNGLTPPSITKVVLKNPRIYPNGPTERDTVRRQLRFWQLHVDFLALTTVASLTL